MDARTWCRLGTLRRQEERGISRFCSVNTNRHLCPGITTRPLLMAGSELSQYYSETLEPSSNVSLLAQTDQEQDDIFYATFPQARTLHWSPHVFQDSGYSQYFGDAAFSLGHHRSRSHKDPDYSAPTRSDDMDVHITTVPATEHSSSAHNELIMADDSCGGLQSDTQTPRVPSRTASLSPECDGSREVSSSPKLEPFDIPLPRSPLQFELEPEAESGNQSKAFNNTHEALMNFLSPPSAKVEAASPGQTAPDVEDTLKIDTTSSPTGTWPSVRVRSMQPISESELSMDVDVRRDVSEPSTSSTISRRVPETITRSPENQSEPPGLMRLSPLPINRRPAEKKKAQTLACNFCRVRKIACGPPLAGTVEKTCNQCQRRSRECVFPTESRRGVRKKKPSASP
ncbi:hypothetical protein F5878DRAFT_603126 [Lentinula raphanica]|uniref:Zn(2)-C6 fungal-type domain-containing protein n=1 Tax=Lentinula raphanica TaxID=153919 RepID=A0AA38UJX0_9AGAR|nr:hypothetical protein F5878DRAFT_603126 [Lentinula raphanica]